MNDLAKILAGEPPYERASGYEPSLLPHVARLCHEGTVGKVISAAKVFGSVRTHLFAWPALWESTFRILLERFPDDVIDARAFGDLGPVETKVYRFIATESGDFERLRERIGAEAGADAPSLLARAVAAKRDAALILDFVAGHGVDDVDAEGIRSLLEAASELGVVVDATWMQSALDLNPGGAPLSRIAHVLPALPDTHERAALALEVTKRLVEGHPWWLVALGVSRLAPLLPRGEPWTQWLPDAPHPWSDLFERLAEAEAAGTLFDEIARAHPSGAELAAMDGPRETTDPVPDEIRNWWGGAPPTAAAPDDMSLDGDADADADTDETADTDAGGRARREKDNRRLGVEAFLGGSPLKNALIADRQTTLTVSIAPKGAVALQVDGSADLDFGDEDKLRLPVRLVHGSNEQWDTMDVLRDPTSRAEVSFEVSPELGDFTALIVVYNDDKSTVAQAGLYTAKVVADELAASSSAPTMNLDLVPARGLGTPGDESTGSVVTDGERAALAGGEIPIRATPQAASEGLDPVTATFETASKNYVSVNGFDIAPALVEAARWGYLTKRRLKLDALSKLKRIQVVSLYPEAVFPLELIYDGAAPDPDATLCPNWKDALVSGSSATCSNGDDGKTICPLKFWGMTKVIEHHVGSTTGNVSFAAKQQFVEDLTQLSMGTGVVMGASDLVVQTLAGAAPAPDVQTVLHDLATEAGEHGSSVVVDGWEEWLDAIEQEDPDLLIAMPHQDLDGHFPALELGGEYESLFLEKHVRRKGDEPGPVVLLLGCDTSKAPNRIGSFASDIREYAPIVVATIGKVVAEEAPLVASTIIDCLRRANQQQDRTVGAALLNARRALLADSRLVGLLLVGHGDARWEVQP